MKRQLKVNEEVSLRVRVSEKDVHYAGGLVNGAWVLGLFGDVGTEVSIRFDGDEGLLAAYKEIKLLAPIHAGDFIEGVAKIVKMGNTSRTLELEARRYIAPAGTTEQRSARARSSSQGYHDRCCSQGLPEIYRITWQDFWQQGRVGQLLRLWDEII